jgi:hypothetical protein
MTKRRACRRRGCREAALPYSNYCSEHQPSKRGRRKRKKVAKKKAARAVKKNKKKKAKKLKRKR